MMTRYPRGVLALLPLLAACTTLHRAPIASETVKSFQPGARVAVSRYPISDFAAMTPGKAVFGVIGAAAMISEGNTFIKNNQVPDPAIAISEGLRNALIEKYQMIAASTSDAPLRDDNIDTIIKNYAVSDFIVDVKTINWLYVYMPVNWDSYHVHYVARARLIDVKNNRIVAEDFCSRIPKELGDAVSQQKLTENHGHVLKSKLSSYAAGCANELAKRMLKVDVPVVADAAVESSTTSPQPGQSANAPAVTDVNAPVPYLKPRGQQRFKEFLTKPLPRAFAISDTGYSAGAWGARPKDLSKPLDTKERALETCKEAAGKECTLYMVDNEIVFNR